MLMKKVLLTLIILFSLVLAAVPSSGTLWNIDFEEQPQVTDAALENNGEIKVKTVTMAFNEPMTREVGEFVTIDMGGCSGLSDGDFGKPLLPFKNQVYKFQPGTKIVAVNFEPELASPVQLTKKIVPSQTPIAISQLAKLPRDDISVDYGPMEVTRPAPAVYGSDQRYPNKWFEYDTGMGLDPATNERTLFMSIDVYPVQYRPALDTMEHLTSAEIEVVYQLPSELDRVNGNRNAFGSAPKPMVEYDMVIIAPAIFEFSLQPLVDHKKNTSIDAKVVTLTDIDDSVYFPKQGVDQQEQIKYFIKNAIENWNITYVLLVGDIDKMPYRKAIIHNEIDGDVPSDLYFADIYDSEMNFDDWDSDNDGIYGEYNANGNIDIDHADLYPDVYLGRLPASSTLDVEMLVDKIIYYELNAAADLWFENATLVGLDTFNEGSGVYEGEYAADYIGDNYLVDFVQTKLYDSLGTCTKSQIVNTLNKGSGFATFHDHGNIDSWAGKFSGADALGLTNGYKMPFLNFDACLTGAFDSNDCIAEDVVLNYNGGAITCIGASRIGYGMWGTAHITRYSGYYNIRLYKNYNDGISIAGKILDAAKLDYLKNKGTSNYADYKTVVEYNLLGDPTLSVGGLPIKFFNITCEDNTSNIDPGDSISYDVTLMNNGQLTRTIRLYIGDAPPGWSAELNQSTVPVIAGNESTVSLTVTVPSEELAYAIGEIDVFAYFSKNKDKTISITTTTIVNRIYGVETDLKPDTSHIFKMDPGGNEKIDIVVYNRGNDVDTIDLSLPTAPSEWNVSFIKDDVVIENIEIDPFKFKVVFLNITVPKLTLMDDYPITLLGSLQGLQSYINDSLSITVSVNRRYGVDIWCPKNEFTIEPGEDVTYQIQINHTGNDVDIIKLALKNVPANWTVDLSHEDNFLIDPFVAMVATLVLSTPEDELAGTYLVELVVQLMGDSSKTTIVTATTINRSYEFDVTYFVDEYVIKPEDTKQIKIYLENLGNGEDSIDLKFVKKPQNWDIKLTRTEDIQLAAFDDTSVDLTVTPPKRAIAGKYNVTIEAALDGDGTTKYINTTAIIERTYDFELICFNDQVTVDPGISAKFEVELFNHGNDVDYVNLTLEDIPDNWKTSLGQGKTIQVEAFSSVKEIIIVTSNPDTYAGEYSLEIVGTILGDDSTKSIPIKVIVIQYFGVKLDIDEKSKTIYRNNEVQYNITIMNVGNGQDDIYREIIGLPGSLKDNIFTRLEYTYTLAPGEVKKETIRIFLPLELAEGYYNFSVRVNSVSDTTRDDKVNTTTLVQAKLRSDEDSKGTDFSDLFGDYFIYLILIIIILIILLAIGVVISRRNRRRAYRRSHSPQSRPPPQRHPGGRRSSSLPLPPPPSMRSRSSTGTRRRDGRRPVSHRGRGRRPKDQVRWRESQLETEEPADDEFLDEEDEEYYDDEEDEDEDEELDDDDEWLDEEGDEVEDEDEVEQETDWEEEPEEGEDEDEDVFEVELEDEEAEVMEWEEPEEPDKGKSEDIDWE